MAVMTWNLDAEDVRKAVKRGLAARLTATRMRIAAFEGDAAAHSGEGGADRLAPVALAAGTDERGVLVAAAVASPILATQRETIERLAPAADRWLLTTYALGSAAIEEVEGSSLPADVGGQAELSVVLLSLLRWDSSLVDANQRAHVAHAERLYRRSVLDLSGSRARGVFPREPWMRLQRLTTVAAPTDLRGLLEFAVSGKRRLLPVVGPDVFSVLQGLGDPGTPFSRRQLVAAGAVMSDWRMGVTFVSLLFLRLLGSDPIVKAFVSDDPGGLVASFASPTQHRFVGLLCSGAPTRDVPKQPTSAVGAPLWLKMVMARAGLSHSLVEGPRKRRNVGASQPRLFSWQRFVVRPTERVCALD